MYTEEEVYELLLKHQSAYRSAVRNTSPLDWSFDIKQWFEQFKAMEKEESQTWEDIEKDYLKEEYPVFGGPFTDALTPFEWLKKYFNSPKRK